MPCNCDGFGPGDEVPERKQISTMSMLGAMVCALMRAISKHVCESNDHPEGDAWQWVLNRVDFEEAGVSQQEFAKWWLAHCVEDTERLREQGLAKLTAAERAALGLE